MSSRNIVDEDREKQEKTARTVSILAFFALLFDGYDLGIYGAVLRDLVKDPAQIGTLDPNTAGVLGSLALSGVLIGSILSAAIGDILGRRKFMIIGIVWYSVFMVITAITHTTATFGLFRFLTGVGLGIVISTSGPMMAEFAPSGRKNYYNAIVYAGIPGGAAMAAAAYLSLHDTLGWRGLFMLGGLPLLLVVPACILFLPESARWALSRGNLRKAAIIAEQTGVPLREELRLRYQPDADTSDKVGYAGLITTRFLLPTALMSLMSFCGLLLTYALNTWLPIIVADYGYGKWGVWFQFVLNLSAVIGGIIAAKSADRNGAQSIIAATFFLAALSLVLISLRVPVAMVFLFIAFAGVGTLGTQVLIFGFQSNYYTSNVRAAGVSTCASLGRLGGILGPLIGGWFKTAGIGADSIFRVFGLVALVGMAVTLLVSRANNASDPRRIARRVAPGSAVGGARR